MCHVALALLRVLDGGGLHEERVVLRLDTFHALDVAGSQVLRMAAHELPHLLIRRIVALPEEADCASVPFRAVLDFAVQVGEILGAADRRDEGFDGEEGGQVGSVRGDHD